MYFYFRHYSVGGGREMNMAQRDFYFFMIVLARLRDGANLDDVLQEQKVKFNVIVMSSKSDQFLKVQP